LDLWDKQAGAFARAFADGTVTFRAVLLEQNRSRGHGFRISLQGICAVPRLFGRFLQFVINGRIVLRRRAGWWFVRTSRLRKSNGERKEQHANSQSRDSGFHL
jgi:hypothetical protein